MVCYYDLNVDGAHANCIQNVAFLYRLTCILVRYKAFQSICHFLYRDRRRIHERERMFHGCTLPSGYTRHNSDLSSRVGTFSLNKNNAFTLNHMRFGIFFGLITLMIWKITRTYSQWSGRVHAPLLHSPQLAEMKSINIAYLKACW